MEHGGTWWGICYKKSQKQIDGTWWNNIFQRFPQPKHPRWPQRAPKRRISRKHCADPQCDARPWRLCLWPVDPADDWLWTQLINVLIPRYIVTPKNTKMMNTYRFACFFCVYCPRSDNSREEKDLAKTYVSHWNWDTDVDMMRIYRVRMHFGSSWHKLVCGFK